MNSSFRNVALAAGIALVVFASGCSSKSALGTDDLAQQRKDVMGTPPPSGAAAALTAKMRGQAVANQQAALQRAQQQAKQGGKQ